MNHRLNRNVLHFMLAAVAGTSITLGAQAQSASPQGARAERTATAGLLADSDAGVSVFDMTFPGGTVGDYFDAIRSIPGVVANVSLSQEAWGVPMPPIRLSRVSVSVAVRAVETITDESGTPIFSTRAIEDGRSAPLYVIVARPTKPGKPEAEILHSFRVASLLDPRQGGGMSADTLLGAIETLLSMDGSGSAPAKAMLHKETSTLIMQGRTGQLQAVENLIEGLELDAIQRRELTKPNQALIADLKAEQQAIRERREIMRERVNLSEKQFVEAERLIAQGLAPQSELETARERMRELEEQRIEMDLRESHISNRLGEALAASGVQQNETFRVTKDRADATFEAAEALAEAMSPPVSVERGDEAELITFRASPGQLLAIRKWLRAQSLLAD